MDGLMDGWILNLTRSFSNEWTLNKFREEINFPNAGLFLIWKDQVWTLNMIKNTDMSVVHISKQNKMNSFSEDVMRNT